MTYLHVRAVDKKLMAAIKIAAIQADVSQREWIISALKTAVGGRTLEAGSQEAVAAVQDQSAAQALLDDELVLCKRCDGPVDKDGKYWRCPKAPGRCGRQLGEKEVKRGK
jgi:hypothetical protein